MYFFDNLSLIYLHYNVYEKNRVSDNYRNDLWVRNVFVGWASAAGGGADRRITRSIVANGMPNEANAARRVLERWSAEALNRASPQRGYN